MLVHDQGLTATQLADMLLSIGRSVSPRAIAKRRGIEDFVCGFSEPPAGRPAKLYRRDALNLWIKQTEELAQPERARRLRSDIGAPRFCSSIEWESIVERTKSLFLNRATPNLLHACEHAVDQLQREGLIDLEIRWKQVYRRLNQDARDPITSLHISEYHRENWRAVHTGDFRRLDTAQRYKGADYDIQSLFESMSIAGPGFGARSFWAIDGHKAHVQALPDELADSTSMRDLVAPFSICISDVLTGMVLWIEPCDSESERTVIRALVNCMCLWNCTPTHGIAMDGGIANATKNVQGLIGAMLPPEAWEFAQRYPLIYLQGSPVVKNPPYIPNTFAKAALERSFGKQAAEHDSTRFPDNYQGGSRLTAVQRRISNQPTVTANTPTVSGYFASLDEFLYSSYIDRERPKQFGILAQRGIKPTIRNAFSFYGGDIYASELPAGDRVAKMLYYIAEHRAFVKAEQGGATCQINRETWNIICPELTHEYWGKTVAIVPVPKRDGLAIVMLAPDKAKTNIDQVRFIGFGQSATVRTYDDLKRLKGLQVKTRNHLKGHLADARAEIKDADWRNLTEPLERPTLPAVELLDTSEPKLAADVYDVEELPVSDTRAARFLNQLNSPNQ